MHEHLCHLLGAYLPHVVEEQMEEDLKEEKNVGKRTREMIGNLLLCKIKSRFKGKGVKKEEEKEKKEREDGLEEGKTMRDRARGIIEGSRIQMIVNVQKIFTGNGVRHIRECGENVKPAHICRGENISTPPRVLA